MSTAARRRPIATTAREHCDRRTRPRVPWSSPSSSRGCASRECQSERGAPAHSCTPHGCQGCVRSAGPGAHLQCSSAHLPAAGCTLHAARCALYAAGGEEETPPPPPRPESESLTQRPLCLCESSQLLLPAGRRALRVQRRGRHAAAQRPDAQLRKCISHRRGPGRRCGGASPPLARWHVLAASPAQLCAVSCDRQGARTVGAAYPAAAGVAPLRRVMQGLLVYDGEGNAHRYTRLLWRADAGVRWATTTWPR